MEKSTSFYDAYPQPPDISPECEDKSVYLAASLETAWRNLPALLGKLNLKNQRKYGQELVGGIKSKFTFSYNWEDVLQKLIPITQDRAINDTIPPQNLNETEARIQIMSHLYEGLLVDLNQVTKNYELRTLEPVDDDRVTSFIWVLRAFRSSLPWNRTGQNAITLNSIPLETVKRGYEYIKKLK